MSYQIPTKSKICCQKLHKKDHMTYQGHLFFINCITNISYKKLGLAGGTKIKIKSVVTLCDEKRH